MEEVVDLNFLKKLNRGAILTSLIVIGAIVYLVMFGISQNAEKPAIKDVCEKYVSTEIAYRMLPEKYRTVTPSIPKSELDSLIATMRSEVGAFYPEASRNSNYIIDTLTKALTDQLKGTGVVLKFTKDIKKYTSFVFEKDTVTVDFDSSNIYETAASTDGFFPQGEKITTDTQDILILQRVDGKWMVVYSNLTVPYGYDKPMYKY